MIPEKKPKSVTNGRFNISINKRVKAEFEHECWLNGVYMSSMIERFMISYVRQSKRLKQEQNICKPEIPNIDG